MNSFLTNDFIRLFRKLPEKTRKRARKNYRIWKENINHPGVEFKNVHQVKPIYSVRIGMGWRAIGLKQDDTLIWFWIGSHNDYDKILPKL